MLLKLFLTNDVIIPMWLEGRFLLHGEKNGTGHSTRVLWRLVLEGSRHASAYVCWSAYLCLYVYISFCVGMVVCLYLHA